jgi:hypothetical protein
MEGRCASREARAWLTAGAAVVPQLGTDADDLDDSDPSQRSSHNVFAARFPCLLTVAVALSY